MPVLYLMSKMLLAFARSVAGMGQSRGLPLRTFDFSL